MKAIARFEKVSKEQFVSDYDLTENKEEVYDEIKLPKRATVGSAGYDFYSPCDFTLAPGQTIKIPTGIRSYIEPGYVLSIYPRSGLSAKTGLRIANSVGIIDHLYHQEIKVIITNTGTETYTINKGDRIAQMLIAPTPMIEFELTEEKPDETTRGGFGSTDTKG
jgi:dUTP pyrophosphatase